MINPATVDLDFLYAKSIPENKLIESGKKNIVSIFPLILLEIGALVLCTYVIFKKTNNDRAEKKVN
jgi:hypothetical protein